MKIISKHPLANACAVVTEDGRASILNITYGAPVPGARIEGNGTLQNPLRVVIEPAFTPQESATLVAALRMYQDRETGDSPGDDYRDIARSAGEPLDVYSGIDSLCEKARAMSGAETPRIVAVISGGVLQSVYVSPSLGDVSVELFDFDDKGAEGCEDAESECAEVTAGLVTVY